MMIGRGQSLLQRKGTVIKAQVMGESAIMEMNAQLMLQIPLR